MAAAYRDYAYERREAVVLVGELVLVTAGAALGASLPGAVEGGWRIWPVGLCLVAAAIGVLVERNGEQRWNEVGALRASPDRAARAADARAASAPLRRPVARE